MVCLWLLIGLGGIFNFMELKKNEKAASMCKALTSASVAPPTSGGACDWLWWLYRRFRRIIGFVPTSSSSLDGACMMVRFSLAINDFSFSPFIFFSFSLDLCAGHVENQISLSIVFFFLFGPSSLIFNFFSFQICFQICCSFLNCYFFFVFNCFLDWFVFLTISP